MANNVLPRIDQYSPLQVRTGRIRRRDLFNLENDYGRDEYANHIHDGQAGGNNAIDQELRGQVVRIDEGIRTGRVHRLVLQVGNPLLRIDEPNAGQ